MVAAFDVTGPRAREACPRTASSGSYVRKNEGMRVITCKLRSTSLKQNEYYGLQ